ncbi:uncharacterized protein LOC5577896 isoform X2 [Aedes aegypti]|uniref:Uncharacterized protein n=1 Tax=Aedes aegypti TaxID=7159 RepID=A0A6I8TT92_AEDAE|nr:uncharacterized protein LOC5577896 isoform X2 [Aedes aegypti]
MEVAAAASSTPTSAGLAGQVAALRGGPFQREVREWQHVDPNTGALLTGRLEADRWVNGPLNSYGKMVSHNLSTPDGSTQHTQKKQMEILQARTASGSLQVVRAQTVQTTSSRWSSSTLHSEICSNGVSTSTTSTSSSSFSNGHSIPAITANSTSSSHRTSALTTNGFSSHHLQQQFHRPAVINSSRLLSSTSSTSNTNGSILHTSSLHQSPQPLASSNGTTVAKMPSSLASTLLLQSNGPPPTSIRSKQVFRSGQMDVGGPTGGGDSFTSHTRQRPLDWFDKFKDISVKDEPADADSFLTRGKSVSIEDLSTERDETNFDDDVEPTQWKRVSKIRRSLQFPRKTAPKISTRPADLPENSVSVSKIRQELENGRRLNTAMRNNHIDFVALDNILNSVSESCPSKAEAPRTPTTPKANTTSFLTAESLKEIRGKLRRLSNESLYRDDMSPGDDRKEDDDSVTITEVETRMGHLQTSSSSDSYKSNSLESTRKGSTDSNSEDWHSRRKSYGFERMSHPSDFMAKMDSSTDSGIGRSTDLSSSWSSGGTDNTAASRGTVVTLGDQKEKSNNPAMVIKITNENQESAKTSYKEEEIKRHSIAVDETSYVRDSLKTMFEKKTSVSVNGFSQIFLDDLSKNRKKVEFCKTEVHFTADSGRVNIVETDEKPPPTNNFRRRRRSSGGSIGSSYLQAISSGVPVTHFGDLEKGVNEADLKDNPVYAAPPVVTTTVGRPEPSPRKVFTTSDDSDGQSADDISLRGILKNKPVKPKPYVLGENLESSDSLWGVKLRPVSTELNYWNEETEEKPQTTEEKEVTSSGNFSTKINLSQPAPSWTPDEFEIVKPSSNGISTTTITSEKQSKTSNIMSIALKSPTPTKKHTAPSPVKATQPQSIEPTQSLSPHFKRHISNAASDTTNGTARNEERASLRLSSGARQLREHELSFFGVNRKQEPAKSSNTTASSSTKPATNTTFTRSTTLTSSFIKRNSINMNPLSTSTSTASTSSNSTTNPAKPHTTAAPTTWQLTNDKPDLLRHSQRVDAIKKTTSTSSTATSLGTSTSTMSSLDPHYENLNLVKPTAMANSTVPSYDRKQDLKRDEQILEELTRAADEILNVVNNMSNAESTESILNEQYRGSGGSGVTLGTIRECSTTNKIMRSRGVQVSKNFDDSLKRHQRSTRVSSASSNESLQRPSPTRTSTANTSLRTGQHPPETRSTTTGSGRRKLTSSSTESRRLIRMCSKERLHQSNASSSEDLPNAASVEPPRRPRRTRYHSSQTGEKSEKDSPRLSASKTSTSDSRRSDERLSSRSHRSERSSTRTSKGPTSGTLASNGVIPTAGVEQQHRIRSKSGASVLQTTSSKKHHR